jgi:hypothetical protein
MTKTKGDGRSSRVRLPSLRLCLSARERRDGRGLRAIGFDCRPVSSIKVNVEGLSFLSFFCIWNEMSGVVMTVTSTTRNRNENEEIKAPVG